jgi:hypothetical protein
MVEAGEAGGGAGPPSIKLAAKAEKSMEKPVAFLYLFTFSARRASALIGVGAKRWLCER